MPVPVLVRVPLVVPMTEPMVVLPAPVTVSARVAPVMPPVENVSVPASDPTVVLLASTTAPVQALALARLRMAPAPPIPVPATLVTGSAMTRPVPSSSTAAPLAMVVPPVVVPRAPLDWTRITPVVTVVPPLYVLVPERVRVPVPVLARATVPEPSASVPANTVEALPARPPDRVTGVAALLVTVLPATPAIEPSVSEKPARSNVAPLLNARAELRPTPLAMPSRTVPAVTEVGPVYVLATESSSVPAPAFVRPPAPVSWRLRVVTDAAALAVRPAAPSAMRLPASVYPVPEIVIELNAVPLPKLFVFDGRAAPAGNTRSSPATGAVPPQLSAVVQFASAPRPVQVRSVAATYGPTKGPPSAAPATPAGSTTSVPASAAARAEVEPAVAGLVGGAGWCGAPREPVDDHAVRGARSIALQQAGRPRDLGRRRGGADDRLGSRRRRRSSGCSRRAPR